MVLRLDSVRARLAKLEEIITRLSELSAGGVGETDFRQNWAVERGLQLGSEVLLDLGHHILVAHFGIAPADYGDVLQQLARAGVISDTLRLRLKGLAGFRNLLVHDYLRLDPQRVAEVLAAAPSDFNAFALAVRRFLESLEPAATP